VLNADFALAAQQDKNVVRQEQTVLLAATKGSLKNYPDEVYDSTQLKALQRIFDETTKGVPGYHW